MADGDIPVGVILAGIAVGFSACGVAIAGLARYFKIVMTERIGNLESIIESLDERNDELNTYIRETLTDLVSNGQHREKELLRIARRCPQALRAEDESSLQPIQQAPSSQPKQSSHKSGLLNLKNRPRNDA